MSLYHINPETGDPGKCKSIMGRCPFSGSPDEHYPTAEDAREAYERSWDDMNFATLDSADVFHVVEGNDVAAKVKLASPRSLAELAPTALEMLRSDPHPAVQAAIAATDKYYEDLDKELAARGADEFMRGEFFSEASPASQKVFRDSVVRAVASLGGGMGVSMRDSLVSPRINAWTAVERKLAGADENSSEAMLEVAKEIETQRNYLGGLHQEQDLNTRKGRKAAAQYEQMVRAMDGALEDIRFAHLDAGPKADPNAQYHWLAAVPFAKAETDPKVPCDDRHQDRIDARGYCAKCGGAE